MCLSPQSLPTSNFHFLRAMSSAEQLYERASEHAHRALHLDTSNNHSEAVEAYGNAVEALLRGAVVDRAKARSARARAIAGKYLSRAEHLKVSQTRRQHVPASQAMTPNLEFVGVSTVNAFRYR